MIMLSIILGYVTNITAIPNNIILFENEKLNLQVRTITNEDGSISVSAEDTAVGFGWYKTEIKNGKKRISAKYFKHNSKI